jgi:hypothetical protein
MNIKAHTCRLVMQKLAVLLANGQLFKSLYWVANLSTNKAKL